MTQYRAIYKDKYEYEFRISMTNTKNFECKNWKGEWKEVGLITDYEKHPQWILVAVH